jgi:hypothetical protein
MRATATKNVTHSEIVGDSTYVGSRLINAADDARRAVGGRAVELVECPVFGASRDETGKVKITIVGHLSRPRTIASVGYRGHVMASGEMRNRINDEILLDEFFRLEGLGLQMPTEAIVRMVEELIERTKPDAQQIRRTCDAVTVAIAARMGCHVEGAAL